LDLLTDTFKILGDTNFVATDYKSDTHNVKIILQQNILPLLIPT